MNDPKVLALKGCTPERLREIFTAKGMPVAGDKCVDQDLIDYNEKKKKCDADVTIRARFENRARQRIYEGISNNVRNSRAYQAVDVAWDAAPIQRQTLPLMMWATGKIDAPRLFGALTRECGADVAKTFFKKIPTADNIGQVDAPRICDFQVDLMRSYITRMHAALDATWSNLYPLYKYNPRSSDSIAQLRGDVLTQRVDIISESFNYRHHDSQCRRDQLLYGRSVQFPRCAWERKTSWRLKRANTGVPSEDEIESYVTREGVDFANPHPNQTFGDMSAPWANMNTDTGPSYMGYWTIARYGSLVDSGASYYNTDRIYASTGFLALLAQSRLFFDYYYDPCVLNFPACDGEAPSLYNTREARVGLYSGSCSDNGVLLTQYFERINPKVEGIGDYDADVWIRLTIGGDYTVLHAEFMPSSIVAAYGAINWNDNRVANQSVGMSLLGYQDQISNITSHMLQQIRASLVQLWLIDKDSLEEKIVKDIEANAMNASWWVDPKVLLYSATKLRELNIQDPRQAFAIIQAQVSNVVESGYKAMGQLLNLADRLLILSPNELGQPNPREVAAREVQEISTSVQSISAFRQQGPREQVAAKKQLIYESLINCGTQGFRVPVQGKYTAKIVKAAGLTVAPEVPVGEDDNQVVPVKTPVLGNLHSLVYDYYFDDRDGTERVLNTQGAQVVMQLLQSLLQIPGLAQKMGLENIYEAANLVVRMSGAPWNFQFKLAEGEDPNMPQPQPEGGSPQQPQQQAAGGGAQQIITELAARVQRLEGMLSQALGGDAGVPPQQAEPSGRPTPMLTEPAAAQPVLV